MTTSINEKLLKIYECIEGSSISSIKIFDQSKGHSNRSVGYAAYEERQHRLKHLSEKDPEIIAFLCKKSGHNYFKFEGKVIKIISSPYKTLNKNVFDRNILERNDGEFENFDPLIRIIYKADYDLIDSEAKILECWYLEIDRNSHEISKEINIKDLTREKGGFITEVASERAEEVELPAGGLLKKTNLNNKKSNNND